jgi:hypothetical protein
MDVASSKVVANKHNRHILTRRVIPPVRPQLGVVMLRTPWKLKLHLRAEIETEEGRRDHYSVIEASRETDGRWSICTTRDDHPPTEISGAGTELPTIVEADGAIVILLGHSPDRLPETGQLPPMTP